LKIYLAARYATEKARKDFVLTVPAPDSWRFIILRVNQQTNGFDCGIFVCGNMLRAALALPEFTQADMPNVRKHIAAQLIGEDLFLEEYGIEPGTNDVHGKLDHSEGRSSTPVPTYYQQPVSPRTSYTRSSSVVSVADEFEAAAALHALRNSSPHPSRPITPSSVHFNENVLVTDFRTEESPVEVGKGRPYTTPLDS